MFHIARSNPALQRVAAIALVLAATASQAHADNLNPVLGGGLGAMAGALIGQSVGGRDGAMIGAAVGGVAGVSIASNHQRRAPEPVRQVVYQQPYQVAPAYGYRVVERVNYYPARSYGHHGWEHGRGWGHDERRWEGPGWDHRGGEHRGWDRRD